MPHICHISTTANLRSGSGRRTLAVLRACLAKGWPVTWICGRSYDIQAGDLPGGKIVVVEDLVKQLNPILDLKALLALLRTVKRIRPDVVHTHLAKAGILGRVAARLNRVPWVVHTVHGPTFAPGVNSMMRWTYWLLEKVAARWTDWFIFVGDELRQSYIRARICRDDKAKVIYTGRPAIDFKVQDLEVSQKEGLRRELCHGDDPDFLLLSIGRIVPAKQQDHAIQVLTGLCRRGLDARLVILGQALVAAEQEHRSKLEGVAADLGLADRVHFPGFRSEVLRVIQAADCVILSSKYEGLPNVALESRIAGTPFVSYDLWGVAEVIEQGRTGLIVPRNDLAELERAVLKIISGDLIYSAQMSLQILQAQFSEERMREEVMDLYTGKVEELQSFLQET